MGERAGYRVIAQSYHHVEKVSPIYRVQWYFGGKAEALEKIITNVAARLSGRLGPRGNMSPVGDGSSALRPDLDYPRVATNFFAVLSEMSHSQYDSFQDDTNCDISDHGLFTLRVVTPYLWVLEHQPVGYNKDGDTVGEVKKLLVATFYEGKKIDEGGMNIVSYMGNTSL